MTDPVLRKTLLSAGLPELPTVADVHVAEVTLGPGVATGRHFHLMNVVGYVTSGTITFQPADSPERTLRSGDAFHEPAGATIQHFDNASPTEPATFVAFYLRGSKEQPLITFVEPAL